MSVFNLDKSVENAERRLGGTDRTSTRRPRSDRGKSRIDPRVIDCLTELSSGHERPPMRTLLRDLTSRCKKKKLPVPSRATVYNLLPRLPVPEYRLSDLPAPVRESLYNLDNDSMVPAHQLAFHCFNYGDLSAASFAAGLPWLALFQALKLRGYRKKSRGLIEAVARARRI